MSQSGFFVCVLLCIRQPANQLGAYRHLLQCPVCIRKRAQAQNDNTNVKADQGGEHRRSHCAQSKYETIGLMGKQPKAPDLSHLHRIILIRQRMQPPVIYCQIVTTLQFLSGLLSSKLCFYLVQARCLSHVVYRCYVSVASRASHRLRAPALKPLCHPASFTCAHAVTHYCFTTSTPHPCLINLT